MSEKLSELTNSQLAKILFLRGEKRGLEIGLSKMRYLLSVAQGGGIRASDIAHEIELMEADVRAVKERIL